MFCADCGEDRRFERPPCADGHGDECPELICTGCGAAVFTGDLLPWPGPDAPEQLEEAAVPATEPAATSMSPSAERSTSAPFRAA